MISPQIRPNLYDSLGEEDLLGSFLFRLESDVMRSPPLLGGATRRVDRLSKRDGVSMSLTLAPSRGCPEEIPRSKIFGIRGP